MPTLPALQSDPIQRVVDAELCSGCGACSYLVPERYRMVDVPSAGRRPQVIASDAAGNTAQRQAQALHVCPGAGLRHEAFVAQDELARELADGWGPVLGLWEGHASDEEMRFAGSSGGVLTALAAFALEQQGYEGVLHTAARGDAPHLNQTVVSRDRTQLLARTGSRYAPASPCDGLNRIEQADGRYVFIGKPCDAAAVQTARTLRPELDRNLGIVLTFFCAGTPSTDGTLAMLRAMGVQHPGAVSSLRYRGQGWPGRASATPAAGSQEAPPRSLSYEESWGGILSKHVQWRCRLCIDHTGEFGDIAVGDAWYRDIGPDEAGSSLIIARTPAGRAFLEAAMQAGHLQAQQVPGELLVRSQPNLLKTRGGVWGRLLGARLVGARVPRYQGLPTFRFWVSELGFRQKLQSVLGTMRRCLVRGLHLAARRRSVPQSAGPAGELLPQGAARKRSEQ